MKRLAAVFAAVLAVCLLASVFTVSAADLEVFTVEKPAGVMDIIDGFDGTVQSRARNGLSSEVNSTGTLNSGIDVLTDGTYCLEFHEKGKPLSYLNIPVCDKDTQAAYEQAGGDYSFNGVDKKYYYSIEYKDLFSDAASFAMYFSNEGSNDNLPEYQIDASFDILVSTDGGTTYRIAWSSVDYVVNYDKKSNGLVERCAGFTYDKGGNMVENTITDKNGKQMSYKYVVANFETAYSNVTNVVYACSALRRNGNQGVPFYYSARISEFDVYNMPLSANALTPASIEPTVVTTAAATTAAGVATTDYPVITGAPVTSADTPAQTTAAPAVTTAAPVSSAEATQKAEEKKSGCGSSVACGCAVAAACACAYVLKKKQ